MTSGSAGGSGRCYAYQYKSEHPDFSTLWDEAEQEAVDAVELEARRRGVEGRDEPVFYKGVQWAREEEHVVGVILSDQEGWNRGRHGTKPMKQMARP
jgi:hypothetical protein